MLHYLLSGSTDPPMYSNKIETRWVGGDSTNLSLYLWTSGEEEVQNANLEEVFVFDLPSLIID